MTVTDRTGADLPDLFSTARSGAERHVAVSLHAGSARSMALLMASATMPMHVREGIAVSGMSTGLVTGGTASGEEAWAGALVAARGCLRMLDSGRITDDGLWQPLRVDEPAELERVQLHRFTVAVDPSEIAEPIMRIGGSAVAADPPGGPGSAQDETSALGRVARAMTNVPAAVSVERPRVPELGEHPSENVRRLFALTVAQLADLFDVTERQMHRYLRHGLPENRRALADALVAVGLTVVGGLGAEGARRWLYSGEPTAAELAKQNRIAELTARAEALRDSPVT